MNGAGPVFLLKDTGQEALLALRARLAGVPRRDRREGVQGRRQGLPGRLVDRQRPERARAERSRRAAAELALDFESAAAVPDVARHESKLPRLAVWHTWADTQTVGWVRLVLDREKVPYAYLRDEDIRAGRLREKFDVIIFGDNDLGLQGQIHGIDKKFGPMAYTKTKESPNLGVPDASDDITGGIGWTGMAKLEEFLDGGGVLVTLGERLGAALDGGLVRDVRRRGGSVLHAGLGAQGQVRAARPPAGLRHRPR